MRRLWARSPINGWPAVSPAPFLLRPRIRVSSGRVTCPVFVVTSLRPLEKPSIEPASDADCTCLTTRAHPRPAAEHVARGRLLAQRLRRVSGAPLLARLSHYRVATQGSGLQVLTCACPSLRAAHTSRKCSALFRSSEAVLSFSLSALLRAIERILRVRAASASWAAQPRNRPAPGLLWAAQPALVTLASLFACACPAPAARCLPVIRRG